ncbi:MAG TPA: pectinesterase family protein [Candidatus Acidoferrales bacterium]|nr:pectinesterase family protein [Candidatus Acidoferrales bacterium]
MKLLFAVLATLLIVAPLRGQTSITVAADGSGQFKSVQEAIMSVPSGSATNPVIIHLKPGTYRELIYVQREKSFFRLIGDDAAKTIIAFNLYAGMTNVDGKPLGTFKTPTATIDADNFTAENITFENSAGPVGQALAIRVDGDRAAFHHCRFLGWQDTILVNRGRQYFDDCYIGGHVDFIFGAATAWFEDCHIHCLRDGYVTAASTPQDQPYGFVFSHCTIDGENGVKTFLGRPWRLYASVTYLNCDLSDVIRPEGWNDWKKPQAHTTSRYAEYNSRGSGANPQGRADWTKQLTSAEAKKISIAKVLGGADQWVPTASFYATSQDIEYGEADGQELLLDAHIPDGDGKFPVAIIVHGGGWSTGDKETDIVPVLASSITNFTWFTIDYRLAPTNRWPACFDDVQTAIRWVKQHAQQYKGDPSRIALIGYSAGGHLVCFAATQASPDTRVQAIVGLAPPADISADAQHRGSMDKWSSMENLLGRTSLDDETLRIMREISPSEHLSASLLPFLLVQGSADVSVPYPLTQRFAAKLNAANVPYDFITITNATHTIADWSKFDPEWQNKVVTWLNDKLATR